MSVNTALQHFSANEKFERVTERSEIPSDALKKLNFEFPEPDPNDLPIFKVVGNSTSTKYAVNYMTYDHHNNPRETALLEKVGDVWVMVCHGCGWKNTKYHRSDGEDSYTAIDNFITKIGV